MTCMNEQEVMRSFTCMAVCIIRIACPAAGHIPYLLAYRTNRMVAAAWRHLAVSTVVAQFALVWSGLVKTCLKPPGWLRQLRRDLQARPPARSRRFYRHSSMQQKPNRT